MTRTITLITATVGAALLFAVPAWGDNWGADQTSQAVRVSPDLEDRAIAAERSRLSVVLDARERALGVSAGNGKVSALEVRERALGTKNEITKAMQPRDAGPVPVRDDRFNIDPTSGPTAVTVSSGREIEWPQLGIGFGIGLVLALGLYLAMKYTRIRPLAH